MTAKNEQQNLINDLKAPIKSFRIFALEEVIRSGASAELLTALEEISRFEDDPECQMLINHAISAVKERTGTSSSAAPSLVIKEADEFFAAWQTGDESQRMRILSNLPARLPKKLQTIGPELLKEEKSPIIAARVIRTFCRAWPKEQFDQIAFYLDSESLVLKLAALKTIVHMQPELLLHDLPVLLNAKDPQIKALAIRGLAKIDKEEALKHLQALLLSPDLSDRLAGIQNCPFLPFEMVKPVLLKYFAAENKPELLIRAGWILEMNPDVQVPFKLFEIAERSPAKKAALVKGILNEAVKLLEKSGILGDQFAAFTRKLQQWVHKRNALRFAKQVVAKLNSEEIDPEVDQTIRKNISQPVVNEAFREALTWPVSETVKGRISAYLKAIKIIEQAPPDEAQDNAAGSVETKAKAEKRIPADPQEKTPEAEKTEQPARIEPVRPPSANILTSLDDSGKIELLAGMELQQLSTLQQSVCNLVAAKNTDSRVKIAALHCFTRNRQKGLETYASGMIASADVALATAAVEYLGEVDPDTVFPFLGQCLKVPDVRMKSAALGILKNFDFNQAVSSLNAMLRSTDPNQQRMALECMDQFDFALVRDQLTDYLCRCGSEDLVEAGLCHFAANPSPDNVYCLYKIEKAHAGSLAQKIMQLREKCSNASDSSMDERPASPSSSAAQDAELQKRYQEEQEKKRTKRPAYAYREVEEVAPTSREQLQAMLSLAREWANERGTYIGIGIILFLGIIFYIFFVPGEADKTLQQMGGAVISQNITIEGSVDSVDKLGAVIFISKDSEKFVLTPQSDGFRIPKRGAKLRISILPYRKTADNMYLVRLISMREISESDQN